MYTSMPRLSKFTLLIAAFAIPLRTNGVETTDYSSRKDSTSLRMNRHKHRSLQSNTTTPNLRSRYKASFGLLLDASCTINSPQLEISCNSEILFENTSDPSVQCVTSSSHVMSCTNTCSNSTTPCRDVYLTPIDCNDTVCRGSPICS
jgi:hypothetical protein